MAAVLVAPVILLAGGVGGLGMATVHNRSMSPTLSDGDSVLYDRVTAPGRGDVVILVDSRGWTGPVGGLVVKRVIGVGGDVIVCCEVGSGRLIVNEVPLAEDYISGPRPGGDVPFRVTVPDSAVWVMGDNRAASVDSRASLSQDGDGAVPASDVRGVVRSAW